MAQANTEKLVKDFAAALLAKLEAAEAKYGYADNWLTDDWEAECRHKLMAHIGKGDALDVAAYAAFIWKRGWSTSPTSLDKARLDAAFEAYWAAEGGTFKSIEAAILAYLNSGTLALSSHQRSGDPA